MEILNNKIKSFEDLRVWQDGHKLVLDIYRITKKFPREEMFGLVMQLRRAGVSFTSNIAEGFSRASFKEKAQFYSMALGSLTEIQSQLMVAHDLDYISLGEFKDLYGRIIDLNKMTNGLIKKSRTFIRNS